METYNPILNHFDSFFTGRSMLVTDHASSFKQYERSENNGYVTNWATMRDSVEKLNPDTIFLDIPPVDPNGFMGQTIRDMTPIEKPCLFVCRGPMVESMNDLILAATLANVGRTYFEFPEGFFDGEGSPRQIPTGYLTETLKKIML